MKIGEYKQMMSYLKRPKQPTEADLKKEDLKPSGDIVRNLLIEEMQTRDLDADEIRYLMDSKPRDNIKTQKISNTGQRILAKPNKANTQVTPFKENLNKANHRTKIFKQDLKLDPSPIVLPPKVEVKRSEEDNRFFKMLEDNKKEKQRIRSSGLGYLMGDS
ncbi:hypothetical protein [Candidatus Pelagibacter sp.]|uniref:hypothetical protein n=1 Tax=Candidatus Pelagibacter sp. TaxID=2024849 RepID=UPI003F854BAD